MKNKQLFLLSDKTEYIAVDFVKLISALLVVGIHTSPLRDVNPLLSYYFNQVLCRLAVPFFFVCSGFFAATKINDKRKLFAYVMRIVRMYVIYTVLYLPWIIGGYVVQGDSLVKSLASFTRNFLFVGSFLHLWYFASLVAAVLLLYVLSTKLKMSDSTVLCLSSLLYVIGVCGDAYREVFLQMPVVGKILSVYFIIFATTRNGLFFGLFFVSIGFVIKKHAVQIPKKHYGLLVFPAFFVMLAEEYLALSLTRHEGTNMSFSMAVCTVLLFLFVAFTKVPQEHMEIGILCRNISTIVYGLHMLVLNITNMFFKMVFDFHVNSIVLYLFVVFVSVLLSVILISLSKSNRGKFLTNLY